MTVLDARNGFGHFIPSIARLFEREDKFIGVVEDPYAATKLNKMILQNSI